MTAGEMCGPERVYARGEAWVECSCGATITCGLGAEFGFSGHAHTDDCLPLACPEVGSAATGRRIRPSLIQWGDA